MKFTDDKPAVTLETPHDPDRVSSFLNIRVKDIEAVYAEWSAAGCSFPDAPETARVRDPLLHPRSRRSSDRSGSNHGPRGGLGACSLAVEYVMTTAIIGTGGIGSAIARRLASGGETLRLSSADPESARVLAAKIGRLAVVAVDNRDALWGADAVVLALRFPVLKGVIDEIADPLTDKLVVVPSNPVGIDAQGNLERLLPKGQSSGEVVAGWLPAGARLAMAFGSLSGDLFESSSNRSPEPAVLFYTTDDRPRWWGSRAVDPSGRLRAGEGRRDRTIESTRGGRRSSRSRSRPRRGAVIDRWVLIARPA